MEEKNFFFLLFFDCRLWLTKEEQKFSCNISSFLFFVILIPSLSLGDKRLSFSSIFFFSALSVTNTNSFFLNNNLFRCFSITKRFVEKKEDMKQKNRINVFVLNKALLKFIKIFYKTKSLENTNFHCFWFCGTVHRCLKIIMQIFLVSDFLIFLRHSFTVVWERMLEY